MISVKNLKLTIADFIFVFGGAMTFDEFLDSVDKDALPSQLLETLTSLWWDKKGDWDTAHTIAQNIPTVQGSAVHAYFQSALIRLWQIHMRPKRKLLYILIMRGG